MKIWVIFQTFGSIMDSTVLLSLSSLLKTTYMSIQFYVCVRERERDVGFIICTTAMRHWGIGFLAADRETPGVHNSPTLFQRVQIYLWKLFALDNGSLCAVERGECVGLISRAALHLYEALPKDLHLKLWSSGPVNWACSDISPTDSAALVWKHFFK